MTKANTNRIRRWLLHGYRVGIFVFVVALVHQQHRWYVAQQRGATKEPVRVQQVRPFYPTAEQLSDWVPTHGGQTVVDGDGAVLGYVVQTSPDADAVVGFSGPTNTLIAFDTDDRILGIEILRTDDTREHAEDVMGDEPFMTRWNGRDWSAASQMAAVDGVSGATLTSLAIADGIAIRLGGNKPSSRFPDGISLSEVRTFLTAAQTITPLERHPDLLAVHDAKGVLLGYAARTSPHADGMMGYQGPTDTLIVTDPDQRVVGLALRHSYDNEPYVGYIWEDEYFLDIFRGSRLDKIAQLDIDGAGIDGVSGATMTSVTVAEALIHAAGELNKVREATKPRTRKLKLAARDYGTLTVVALALTIGLTRLRGNRRLRLVLQIVLIVYLGFINADMVSQALLAGWAQNGIGWRGAPALAIMTIAALVVPATTGRQVYCTHICPHGAAQELLRRRIPWKVTIAPRIARLLKLVPAVLLLWVVLVALGHLPFSLVGIEPFDAYVVRVAGWATIIVAVVGLAASMFVPMAYCRYGCPTGAMLSYLRIHARSDRWSRRDWLASGLAILAFALWALR